MPEQHRSRRWILAAFVVLVAASAALGSGYRASATDDGPRPRPDYASKEAFKLECELLGGTFTETAGYTYCHHEYRTVQCDANGKDCTSHPTSWQPQPSGENSYDGSVDQVAKEGGGAETPAPAVDSPTPPDAHPSVGAPADDQDPKAKAKHGKKKGKNGKKHGRGKGRK